MHVSVVAWQNTWIYMNCSMRLGAFLTRCKYVSWWLHTFYLMTSVKISGGRGWWESYDFPTPNDPYSHGPWDKSKNPYPLRNHIISKKNHIICNCSGPRNHLAHGPRQLPRWGLCDFSTGMRSCYVIALHNDHGHTPMLMYAGIALLNHVLRTNHVGNYLVDWMWYCSCRVEVQVQQGFPANTEPEQWWPALTQYLPSTECWLDGKVM